MSFYESHRRRPIYYYGLPQDPKMYVIRPQFFKAIITLLVNAAKKTVDYQRQLVIARSQSVDVTNFENQLLAFKDAFGRNYRLASEKFKTAIDEIDKSIAHLQKIKDAIIGSENNLRLANDKADNLTIKRLTRGNPTMKAKFDESRQNAQNDEPEVQELQISRLVLGDEVDLSTDGIIQDRFHEIVCSKVQGSLLGLAQSSCLSLSFTCVLESPPAKSRVLYERITQ